ncbi:MAG: DUF362 domain-containing protein [Oscillospiraceae bacterium]
MNNKVCLDSCDSYEETKLLQIVRRQFTALQVEIKSGMTVVIKPNLVTKAAPNSGIITHPKLVEAVGLVVQERGGNVLIAESSGGLFTPTAMNAIFSACGYTEIAKRHNFSLYLDCESTSVDLPDAVLCKRMNVINPYIHADYIINIAKLKSHCMTMLSGAVKNLFGTVPGLMKPELHCRFPNKSDFAQMLVDLCEYVRPNLSIIDGIDAMEGDGPTGGVKRFMGVVIASESPYAADMTAAAIANMNPASVLFLNHAARRGLCPKTTDSLELLGDSIESHLKKDFKLPKSKDVDFIARLPRFLRPVAKKIATPYPTIRRKQCIGCGKCAESCPAHTIQIVDCKAVISYSSCIHCFCCHEMCPLHVIDIKRFSLFNL